MACDKASRSKQVGWDNYRKREEKVPSLMLEAEKHKGTVGVGVVAGEISALVGVFRVTWEPGSLMMDMIKHITALEKSRKDVLTSL